MIITPPFTEAQKKVIEATDKIANGEKICDVDGIDEMADGRYVFDTDVYLDALDKKKPMTNEEWFCGLPTTKKSKFMAILVTEAIKEHNEHGVTRCEAVIWWDEWLKQPHKE